MSVDAVVQALRLHEPPTLWRAVGYTLAVAVVSVPLEYGWRRLCRRVVPDLRNLDCPGFSVLRATHPSSVLADVLPSTTPTRQPRPTRNPDALEDLAGHWDVYGYIAMDATSEELYFRGVPLVIALGLGVTPVGAVLFGTLLWASLHRVRNWANTLLMGLVYAWLWLGGAWALAIGLHVAQNWLAHTSLRLGCWLENGRYPRRRGTDA